MPTKTIQEVIEAIKDALSSNIPLNLLPEEIISSGIKFGILKKTEKKEG